MEFGSSNLPYSLRFLCALLEKVALRMVVLSLDNVVVNGSRRRISWESWSSTDFLSASVVRIIGMCRWVISGSGKLLKGSGVSKDSAFLTSVFPGFIVCLAVVLEDGGTESGALSLRKSSLAVTKSYSYFVSVEPAAGEWESSVGFALRHSVKSGMDVVETGKERGGFSFIPLTFPEVGSALGESRGIGDDGPT